MDHAGQSRDRRGRGVRLRADPGRCAWNRIRCARIGEKLVVALELLPQFIKDVGIATHHVVHVFKGADLAGTVCAHPLRGRGYDFDVPVLFGDFVTTRGRHRLRAHRARRRRGRLRARPRARPGSGRTRWATTAPSMPGCRCSPACMSTRRTTRSAAALDEAGGLLATQQAGAFLSALLAVPGAADLPRHAAMVHPAGWAGAHP